MTKRAVALHFTLLSLAVAPCLHAEPQVPAAPPVAAGVAKQSSREMIQQKLQLVKMLLAQATAIERAASSDDPAIMQQSAEVLALYAKANSAFNEGDMAEAEKLLDEVLRLITDISRLAPDPVKVEAEQRARYAELLENVRGIQVTYHVMRNDMSSNDKQLPIVIANLERNRSLIDQAQALEQDKRYKEAIELLDKGYTAGVSDLNMLMGSVVKSYELKFNSPVEEFAHEVTRYHSYEELIPIAYAELKPSEGSVKLSESYVQESRNGRDTALKQAAGGDHQTAIGTLQEATKRLQAALRTLGLTVPE